MNTTLKPILCGALVALLLLGATACTKDAPSEETSSETSADTSAATTVDTPTDTTAEESTGSTVPATSEETTTATDPATETTTETDTDAETTGETETTAETETGPVALLTCTPPVTVSEIAFPGLAEVYRESHTFREGVTSLDKAGVTMTWSSEFYGHDSAINRDYCYYGRKYQPIRCRKYTEMGSFFTGNFDGGYYDQLVQLNDGVLTIRTFSLTKNGTYTFDGREITSIYGKASSDYRITDTRTVEVGLDAVLRGTGRFNHDDFTDLLLVGRDQKLYLAFGSREGFAIACYGTFTGKADQLFAGDIDADGLSDLLYIDGDILLPLFFDGQTFTPGTPVTSPLAIDYRAALVGDVNQDSRTDVMLISADGTTALSLFGRGDGFFGPHEDEITNDNLFGRAALTCGECDWYVLGDLTGEGVPDLLITTEGKLFIGIVDCDPTYDYSIFGMILPDGTYRIYSGGRWNDTSGAVAAAPEGRGDGDHVMIYDSKDGRSWLRHIEGPAFYLGWELGVDEWWSDNTLEPEVICVDGVYHMFLQSSNHTESGYYGDYINYAFSTDGYHFERKTDRPVILPDPTHNYTQFKEVYGYEIGFNHEEVIYVPDDPDGRCFWMYTGHFINNNFSGYVLIRSADPTTFYWSDRESTNGIAQIGNQIAYINDFDGEGHRLFLRITFFSYTDEDGTRTVPTFQYSTDGRNFTSSDIPLAGPDVTDPITEANYNTYFLGFCTLCGTGEIPAGEDGSYRLVYLATTATQPAGIPIFWAEGGAGEVTFRLEP